MQWYERFGYTSNPFELDPFVSKFTLVNHTNLIEDIFYLVHSGSMFVIEGDAGTGKTMFLKNIIDRFKGKGNVIYLDGRKIADNLDIETVLNRVGGNFLNRVLSKKPQDIILLLDNVDKVSIRNCEKIKYYFDQGYIRSVVFTTENYKSLKITKSIRDRIVDRVILLPKLNKFDALRIVRDRFSDHFFLPDEVILKIVKLSGDNIKKTIVHCNDVCAFVVKEGRGEVLPKYLPIIIKQKKKKSVPIVPPTAAWKDTPIYEVQKAQ